MKVAVYTRKSTEGKIPPFSFHSFIFTFILIITLQACSTNPNSLYGCVKSCGNDAFCAHECETLYPQREQLPDFGKRRPSPGTAEY